MRIPRVLVMLWAGFRPSRIDPWSAPSLNHTTAILKEAISVMLKLQLPNSVAKAMSFASIHTATYPVEHDVVHSTRPLPPDRRTMAEHFRERGLRTAAFVSCSIVASRYGFAKGFEHYDEDFESTYAGPYFERDGASTASRAIEWLGTLGEEEAFFSWVHFFDPHAPYRSRDRTDLDEKPRISLERPAQSVRLNSFRYLVTPAGVASMDSRPSSQFAGHMRPWASTWRRVMVVPRGPRARNWTQPTMF